MKFKKIHILLIAISIFLLISIGSVCASENITGNSDDAIADDGTDVVLSDTDENVPDETSDEKINTSVETDKDSYEFKKDSNNKTMSVDVKDNKSSKIDVNKSDLSIIDENNKIVSFEYNSSVITITEPLAYGYHNLTINYLGNMDYYNSSRIVSVKIFGNNTIETETSVVCDGKIIEIPVAVNDQVDNITLVKNNFNLTLIYTNENGNISNLTIRNFNVEDGKIKFESPVELINASLIIDYANATEPKTVAIKVSTEIKATVDKDKYESEEIKNISIEIKDGQGNLINVSETDLEVFENGAPVDFIYNYTNITITSIIEGSHNLTIVFKGNETYNSSNTTVVLNVYGKNQIIVPAYVVSDGQTVEIPITIFNGLENVTVNATYLTLNLTYTNATGNANTSVIENFQLEDGKLIRFGVNGITLNEASATVDYVNSAGAKTVKINLATAVEAISAKPKYRYNETNNITVSVLDNNGEPLNINANDLKVFDNGNEIQFTFNNSNITVNLEQGVHNLTVTYKGNDTYNSSSKTIELKVYGDLRIDPDESVVLDETNKATISINLNDGADLIDLDIGKLNVTLFYTVGNKTLNENFLTVYSEGQDIILTINQDFDSAYVHIVYDKTLTGNTTIKVNTTITSPDSLQIGDSQVKNFTIEVKGTNGHIINVTDKNIKVLNNGTALNITVNNSIITINNPLTYGIYNLTIVYLGTETYLESTKTLRLTICGINATSAINVNSSKKGELKFDVINGNETVPVDVDELNMTVTYKDGNETKVIPITSKSIDNGTLIFTLENVNFTTATLTIDYKNGTSIKNITVNRIFNVRIEIINAVNEYRNGNFTFRLVDEDDENTPVKGKTLSLMLKGNISVGYSATTNDEGIASFKTASLYTFDSSLTMKYLEVGNHLIELSTKGNVKSTSVTTNLTVNMANIIITIDPYKEYYGSDKKVKITVTNANNGEPVQGIILHLYMPQTSGKDYYFQTNVNGTSEIGVSGLVGGDYAVTVSNNDTKNINNASTNSTITILQIPVVITTSNLNIYYNSGNTATIKITDKATGKAVGGVIVLVQLDDSSKKTYLFQANEKGQVSFAASLAVGKHKIVISTADTRYKANTVTKTITVKKASATIKAPKVTDYYKGVKYFTIKLTNSKTKKAIYDAKINVKIFVTKNKYYNYNGKTGANGQIKLILNTLKPGTYKVEVSGADSKSFTAKKVTSKIVIKKAPAKLVPKKLTAKKGAKKYFKVTVKNKKTKKVIAGVKVKIKVYTGKKVKTYTKKTNSKGIAKLPTKKLKVGKHKVFVRSANKYVTAKQAKSLIKIKK